MQSRGGILRLLPLTVEETFLMPEGEGGGFKLVSYPTEGLLTHGGGGLMARATYSQDRPSRAEY